MKKKILYILIKLLEIKAASNLPTYIVIESTKNTLKNDLFDDRKIKINEKLLNNANKLI